nr:SulP family inorganic anion transporter [uncultured Sellimonas sp.]
MKKNSTRWIFPTLKGYRKEYLLKDIFSGIIITAVSIPISMGYAEVAGLPAVYGLYGSVLPILFFALFTTSPQFIFGVDAAPAAIVGSALASLGIESASPEAMSYVPLMAVFTGIWLLIFYFLKAGKIIDYISTPVMGGFITGIAITIIMMQIPKILGSTSGSGEALELLEHIKEAFMHINLPSVLLGIGSFLLLGMAKRWIPKFPMAIVIMGLGVAATMLFHVDRQGVRLLSEVEPGFPGIVLPDFSVVDFTHVIGRSVTIAAVVMSESLLAENNFAARNGYKIQDSREILACAAGNIISGFTGSCPVNGSISRTSMNEQFSGKTQVVSVTAAVSMLCILSFCTGFIGYLPVPVLTAIVISALLNVVELRLAKRLFRVSRKEFYIFMAACGAVLFLGTIYGVVIGIILSFVAVIIKETNPPRAFLGIIPGREGFYDLKKNRHACPIKNVVIYRFSESLFFANIKIFREDIEGAIRKNTKAVIIDAGAVTSLDITAADGLMQLSESLKKRGIRFYMTEHMDTVNEEMRNLGIGELIRQGMVRRTITSALCDLDFEKPYPLENTDKKELSKTNYLPAEEENSLEEFAWAFGEETVRQLEEQVHHLLEQIHGMTDVEEIAEQGIVQKLDVWDRLGAIDEDEILRRMELHLDELPEDFNKKQKIVLKLLEKRRRHILEELRKENPEKLEQLKQSREKLERRLKKQNPKAVEKLHQWEILLNEKEEGKQYENTDV